jgi:hypothetical protein
VADHEVDLLEAREILPPFARGEVPEDGEDPQGDQRPRGIDMQLAGLFEA